MLSRILNLIFIIIIWFLSSFTIYIYNTINEINFSIKNKINEINKIKETINKIQEEENRKNKLINEASSNLSVLKKQSIGETKYILEIYRIYDNSVNITKLENNVKYRKSNIFQKNMETNYVDNIRNTYLIIPNKEFKRISNTGEIEKLTEQVITLKISLNYKINEDKLISTLQNTRYKYNIKFIAKNFQNLFTYLADISVKYKTSNQLEELNLLDILDKYSILFNKEERKEIKEFIKNKIYEILNN